MPMAPTSSGSTALHRSRRLNAQRCGAAATSRAADRGWSACFRLCLAGCRGRGGGRTARRGWCGRLHKGEVVLGRVGARVSLRLGVGDALEMWEEISPCRLDPFRVLELERDETDQHLLEIGQLLPLEARHLGVDPGSDCLVLPLGDRVDRLGLAYFRCRLPDHLVLAGPSAQLLVPLALRCQRPRGLVERRERCRASTHSLLALPNHPNVIPHRLLKRGALPRGLLIIQVGHAVDAHAHRRERLCQRRIDLGLAVGQLCQAEPKSGHGAGESAVPLDELLRVLVHRSHLRLHRVGVVAHLRACNVVGWFERHGGLARELRKRAGVGEQAGLDIGQHRHVRRRLGLLGRFLPLFQCLIRGLQECLQVGHSVQLWVRCHSLKEALQLRPPPLHPFRRAAHSGDAHGRHLCSVLLRKRWHNGTGILLHELAVQPVEVTEPTCHRELAIRVLRQRCLGDHFIREVRIHPVPLLARVRHHNMQVRRARPRAAGHTT
mmetsp:Transcript_2375/g.7580  ORF Transcript_2375/g.7580 Transcript_2375/m.7580 type:complete len:492 (+) Transcript_2375:204-1679(+)